MASPASFERQNPSRSDPRCSINCPYACYDGQRDIAEAAFSPSFLSGIDRLAERQHQPVRPGEHRDRMGEVDDLRLVEASIAERLEIGGIGLVGRPRQLRGVVDDRPISRFECRAEAFVEQTLDDLRLLGQLCKPAGVDRGATGTALPPRPIRGSPISRFWVRRSSSSNANRGRRPGLARSIASISARC